MDNHIWGKCTVRLSGELTDLEYDAAAEYPDDGSLLLEDDTLEDTVQSDPEMGFDDSDE